MSLGEETALLPSLLLLGNPKSGSTFLFNCLRTGPFDPNVICGTDVTQWRGCRGRGYLLTTLGAKKEFNYWVIFAVLVPLCVRFQFEAGRLK